jgi:hypothetical protein
VRQRRLVVAGDALVAIRHRHELVAADDVLDAGERLVAGPLEDLAQDGVRRVAAVGADRLRP